MYLQNVLNTIRKKEKEKGLTKLIRLFGNVTDQIGVREAIIALGFLSRKITSCLGFYYELSVLD